MAGAPPDEPPPDEPSSPGPASDQPPSDEAPAATPRRTAPAHRSLYAAAAGTPEPQAPTGQAPSAPPPSGPAPLPGSIPAPPPPISPGQSPGAGGAHPAEVGGPDGQRGSALSNALRAPLLRPLLRIPLKKVAIWAAVLGLIWALKDFFGVIFMTFVITYIATSIVDRVSPYFTSRKVPVLLVFALIIGAFLGFGFATVPRAAKQGRTIIDRLKEVYQEEKNGEEGTEEVAKEILEERMTKLFKDTPVLREFQRYLGDPAINRAAAEYLAKLGNAYLVPGLKALVASIWQAVLFLFLALLFSFMIVWDFARLGAGVAQLEHSRLGDVWGEVGPSIATFFRLLGRAFEAQTMIALCNTALTAAGMWLLGLEGIGILSVIVFLCSFVPIVGVFISTVPMCAVALQMEDGGVGLSIGVIVLVTVIHLIEAYVLNPRIYGYHMKLHPVAVLIVLYLGQHLFGIWGLVIGVPMATYVWRHLIMGEHQALYGPGEAGISSEGGIPSTPPL